MGLLSRLYKAIAAVEVCSGWENCFLALYLPADNPFWNAVENEGAWTDFEKDRVYCKYAEDAHILVTDYPNIGASELRSTTSHSSSNYHCVENYNRLSYNSEFPWQADGKNGEVAMSYVVKNKEGKWEPLRNYSFKKYEDGFYCREVGWRAMRLFISSWQNFLFPMEF